MSREILVKPLLPVTLGKSGVTYAQGVRAGRWVFATGHMAQDFETGIAADVLAERLPHAGAPKREKEAAGIFDHFEAVLDEGGATLADAVRTDQYYTTVDAVPPYQAVRRRRFGALIPPSTSIVMDGFALPDADMNVSLIAAVPESGFEIAHISHEVLAGRPTSGYSPALTVGDYVFVPGNTAMAQGDEPRRGAVARAALMEDGMQWGGQPIKLETEFIISQRLKPSLELAGSSLDNVVKAQAYLTRPEDYAAFNDVWMRHVGGNPPAMTVVPCADRGLAPDTGTLEINVLALKTGGATEKQAIDADVFPGFHGWAQAVRAGDLLFLSGLMAADEDGLVDAARPAAGQPHYHSTAGAEAEHIIDNAAALCAAAGTSLDNVVRVQQFHTDLEGVHPALGAWRHRLGEAPLPFTAVAVPGPLPVPGSTMLMDIWVYAP